MTAPLWYFRERSTSDGPVFEPGENSAGPWAPDMMHGRFFGGLAAREAERLFVEELAP